MTTFKYFREEWQHCMIGCNFIEIFIFLDLQNIHSELIVYDMLLKYRMTKYITIGRFMDCHDAVIFV